MQNVCLLALVLLFFPPSESRLFSGPGTSETVVFLIVNDRILLKGSLLPVSEEEKPRKQEIHGKFMENHAKLWKITKNHGYTLVSASTEMGETLHVCARIYMCTCMDGWMGGSSMTVRKFLPVEIFDHHLSLIVFLLDTEYPVLQAENV